jgi:DNA-binding MarR family transcriptional regulator
LSPPCTQQIANELREANLVEQVVNRAHKRSWLIGLTPKGLESFERGRAQELTVIKRAAAGLSSVDIDACLRVIAHLTEAFEKVAREA